MGVPQPHQACYLVEWYEPELTDEQLHRTAAKLDESAASMSADGSPVGLLMTLAVPTDEVVFGLFAAESPLFVAAACIRAGMAAQRLTAASRLAGCP